MVPLSRSLCFDFGHKSILALFTHPPSVVFFVFWLFPRRLLCFFVTKGRCSIPPVFGSVLPFSLKGFFALEKDLCAILLFSLLVSTFSCDLPPLHL